MASGGNNAGFFLGKTGGAGNFSAACTVTPPAGVVTTGSVRPCVYITDYPPVVGYDLSGNTVTATLTGTAPYRGQYGDGSSWTLTSNSSLTITDGNGIAAFTDATGTPGTVLCGNAAPSINLTSGDDAQTVCNGIPIEAIAYTIGGSASNYEVTGLPTGVAAALSGKIITLAGTPTLSGAHTYTIETRGQIAPCAAASITGMLTVEDCGCSSHVAGSIGGSADPDCEPGAPGRIGSSAAGACASHIPGSIGS